MPKRYNGPVLAVEFAKREHRFWMKVNRDGQCWIWLANKRGYGYGQFSFERRSYTASRLIFAVTYLADIHQDVLVCHSCDNPSCVNPDHLFVGTHQANRIDCVTKGRANVRRGEAHEWTKLSDRQVQIIKSRYQRGLCGYKRLAKEFSVVPNTIKFIVHGINRKR